MADDVDTAFRDFVNQSLEDGRIKMKRLEEDLKANTDATARVEKNTKDIVDVFDAMKGGLQVLTWVGRVAKPLTAIVLFFSAMWGVFVVLLKRGT